MSGQAQSWVFYWKQLEPTVVELNAVNEKGSSGRMRLDWFNVGPPDSPRFELEARISMVDIPRRELFDDVMSCLSIWENNRRSTPMPSWVLGQLRQLGYREGRV